MSFDDYSPEYNLFADFLGVDVYSRQDGRVKDKISTIYEWGIAKSKSKDPIKIVETIKGLVKNTGVTFRGKELTDHLFRWVRIDMDSLRLKQEENKRKEQLVEEHLRAIPKVSKESPKDATHDANYYQPKKVL